MGLVDTRHKTVLFRREEEGKTAGAVGVGGERKGRFWEGVVKLTKRLMMVGLAGGRLELFPTLLH